MTDTDTTSYAETYVKGMTQAITSDPIVTSLFLGAVAVGRRRGILAGIAAFFLGYAAMGEVTNLAMTIGKSTQGLSRAVVARQMANMRPPQPTATPAWPEGANDDDMGG